MCWGCGVCDVCVCVRCEECVVCVVCGGVCGCVVWLECVKRGGFEVCLWDMCCVWVEV